MYALLGIVSKQRQVEDQRQPVSVDEEQERHESVDGDFGDDVGVEAVAEVNGVDVVAAHTHDTSAIVAPTTTTGRASRQATAAMT
jgi:hypothetical protein